MRRLLNRRDWPSVLVISILLSYLCLLLLYVLFDDEGLGSAAERAIGMSIVIGIGAAIGSHISPD